MKKDLQWIALDPGLSFVKAVEAGKMKEVSFPSGLQEVSRQDALIDGNVPLITWNGRMFQVGEEVVAFGGSLDPTEAKLTNLPVFLGVAASDLGVTGRVGVITCLPGDVTPLKPRLEQVLAGEHHYEVKGKTFSLVVEEVMLTSEGIASWFDFIIQDGRFLEEAFGSASLVIDIGSRTTDVVYVVKGVSRRQDRFVLELGVDQLIRDLFLQVGPLSPAAYKHFKKNLLSGIYDFTLSGRRVKLTADTVRKAKLLLVRQVLHSALPFGISRGVEQFIFVGGGASFLKDELMQVMQEEGVAGVFFAKNPFMANARGMAKFIARR